MNTAMKSKLAEELTRCVERAENILRNDLYESRVRNALAELDEAIAIAREGGIDEEDPSE